jgi:outer membrane protein OmpA-like peptidoglycan-associated protein
MKRAPARHLLAHRRIARFAAAFALAVAATATARQAAAAPFDYSANGEVGAGSMLSGDQRNKLDFGLDIQGSLRPGIVVADPLVAQLALSNWLFPSGSGYGRSTLIGGGLRLEPPIGDSGRLFVDAHAGVGLTGGLSRFMFDAGVGFEWTLTPQLGLGPALRYGQLHSNTDDRTVDAKFWSLGLSVTLRPAPPAPPPPEPPPPPPPPPPKPAPPKDSDGDGVTDDLDKCPDKPEGTHPDPNPERKGCPAGDADLDGVTDDVDKCPNEAQGVWPDPDRPGCPDKDDDRDGVPNHEDQCPAEAAGLMPDPQRKGCPAPDRDHDFVPDGVDACPDKPGAPNEDPKKNGCPGLLLIEPGQIRINRPVFFATDKDTILKKSFPVLKAVGDALKSTPGVRKISIEGHTDDRGNADHNLELSQRRADSVRTWLIEHGIDAERLEAKGFGSTQPIRTNKTAKGRAENRRVQFTIIDPAQAPAAPITP